MTGLRAADRRVVVSIPQFKCKAHVRQAVDSLLQQTHRNLTVVVANDGDTDPPWEELASIHDVRLVRFELKRNRGPYFATSVVLHAADAPYLLIQDADDWSDPRRVSLLLAAVERDRSDFAVSAQSLYAQSGASLHLSDVRWVESSTAPVPPGRFIVNPCLTSEYRYRAPHHGLFRCHALRDVGAYYAGFRLSYDRLLTNLMLMTGRVSHVTVSLYCRLIRADSITHSPLTGWNSEMGRHEFEIGQTFYGPCFERYREYLGGRLSHTALLSFIRKTTEQHVTEAERSELHSEVQRLRALLVERQSIRGG
ncbi:MAG: glycosyltransferase family 2 protein [Acidobacteriia bacterium]|nr:glycosyltransferase family 2 protein [Terriglobia bacterium]